MSIREEPIVFDCCGETLIGVVARPDVSAGTGVLVVVGGPQYRAGSHRQFVMLARFLAARGIPVMRFDYRGMGDSTGDARDFTAIDEDIGAAIAAFRAQVPGVERIVLWGLCDGASASCFHAPANAAVVGVVLVNPWVRTESGQAQAYLKHYYAKRLFDPAFLKKLVQGGVDLRTSVRALLQTAAKSGRVRSRQEGAEAAVVDLPDRMLRALQTGAVRVAIVLSGRDYVAREFEQVSRERGWRELLAEPRVDLVTFEGADHTFSSRERRDALAGATFDWLVRTGLASAAVQ